MRVYSQLNYTMLYIAALINAPVRGGKRLSSCRHYSKREAASISVHTIRQGGNFDSVCVMSDDKKTMYVLGLISIRLEAITVFEEQQNGLYDMLLSATAMFYIWENRIIGSTQIA